jgi:hypothetical protein
MLDWVINANRVRCGLAVCGSVGAWLLRALGPASPALAASERYVVIWRTAAP